MNMVYVFHFLVLCQVILIALFYRLGKKFLTTYHWHTTWKNTVNLEHIVREIVNKACIISIIENRDSKLTGEEKENKIIETACAITADVLLQHTIEPKNYELGSLVKVEIFRINSKIK